MRRNEHTARLKLLIDLITLVIVAIAYTGVVVIMNYAPYNPYAERGALAFLALASAAIIAHFATDFLL